MELIKIDTSKLEEIGRDQVISFLDTKPTEDDDDWALLGIGITDYGVSYNPQVNSEKWIVEKNARNSLQNNQKQGDVSQKMHKGDPCFEFVNTMRDQTGSKVASHVLDIDTWDAVDEEKTKFKAKRSDCIVVITKYMADTATIEYTLYYNGDPVEGYVTIEGNKPTFTPGAYVPVMANLNSPVMQSPKEKTNIDENGEK